MAIPYFYLDSTHKVYFTCGFIIPVPKEYHRNQSVGRTQDGTLKVYDQIWKGTYKRIWKVKVYMTDDETTTYYRLSDLLTFIHSTVVFAKIKFTFYDSQGNSCLVRMMSKPLPVPTMFKGWYEIDMELEEDYA